ncbi:MAG: hypothetical protein JXA73_19280 [Acidobacteria bacterium]|nr:hypothetical protein [Acidobacteriota bacterium]
MTNRKNSRRWSPPSFLCIAGLLLMLLVAPGCSRKASAPVTPPIQSAAKPPSDSAPQAVTPSVIPPPKPVHMESVPVSKAPVAPNNLDLGIKSFRAGEFEEAAQYFEDYVGTGANMENRDLALFHLFLARTLMGNSGKNLRKAGDALKRLVNEFPKSQYRNSAELIAGLQAQIENMKSDVKEKETRIKQLNDELQKLKEIDLQRRPSRPPY